MWINSADLFSLHWTDFMPKLRVIIPGFVVLNLGKQCARPFLYFRNEKLRYMYDFPINLDFHWVNVRRPQQGIYFITVCFHSSSFFLFSFNISHTQKLQIKLIGTFCKIRQTTWNFMSTLTQYSTFNAQYDIKEFRNIFGNVFISHQ